MTFIVRGTRCLPRFAKRRRHGLRIAPVDPDAAYALPELVAGASSSGDRDLMPGLKQALDQAPSEESRPANDQY